MLTLGIGVLRHFQTSEKQLAKKEAKQKQAKQKKYKKILSKTKKNMTHIQNKKTIISIREKAMEKLIKIYKKLERKVDRLRQEILKEIEADFLFNDLTAKTQTYSLYV